MEFLLKGLSPKLLLALLPMLLMKLGNYFKNKDADNVGRDDVAGNICHAFGQAFDAYEDNNENAFRKGLTLARNTIDHYLKTPNTPQRI